ncbi:MAG: hypothetical protein WC879_11685 [Melioribacteraceae bacterium]
MKSIRAISFVAIIFFCIAAQITNAQEKVNRTEQLKQIKEAEANRKALIADLTNLASLAQQHYRKPTVLCGDGNSFGGWFIPEAIDTTANGVFTAMIIKDSVVFVGTGNAIGKDGKKRVQIFMSVYPDLIKSVITRN